MTIYESSVRSLAADMFEAGRASRAVASRLGLPRGTVRQWLRTYRATGRDGLLGMGHRAYDWETKVAAARAVVELGRPKPEVMAEMGIASKSPLDGWCRSYREGGAEALRPRPKGRPRGAAAAPPTREEALEREVRRLEAQVAYLKKSIALKAARDSRAAREP